VTSAPEPSQADHAAEAIRALHYIQSDSALVIARTAGGLGIAAVDVRALYFMQTAPDATPKHLAEHLGLTTGAVTSLVDRLVTAGFAKRIPNPEDRRSVVLELTSAGNAAVDALIGGYNAALTSAIDAEQLAALARSLTALQLTLAEISRAAVADRTVDPT
jgi:DNA-binding MarR family transcriptional regulator